MASKPTPGVAVFTMAIVNLDQREAIPISFEQAIQTDQKKEATKERM